MQDIFVPRIIQLPTKQSFFLFGARNTGKSLLLKNTFNSKNSLWLDLLNPDIEDHYSREPMLFKQQVLALGTEIKYVIIDEIQKLPKLLDLVHLLIESTDKIFIMTGSSARKLRQGGANLLAGRAFVYNLFPLTYLEIIQAKPEIPLADLLQFGSLPAVLFKMESKDQKVKFLQAYAQTYLKEEIWLEQFIRKIDPFRKFLEVAAQANGQIINFSNIAKDVGVDDKTIKQYYSILEDTLMGFYLETYHDSTRKRVTSKPKFYFFDTGICRALCRRLSVPLTPGTSEYGLSFEHFIILECLRLASYYYPEYKFSYLRTKDDVEIDLIVERPGLPTLCIEIKSAVQVRAEKLLAFQKLATSLGEIEAICISQEKHSKKIGDITVYNWSDALRKFFVADQ